jgi:hypothetical protein
MSFYKDVKKAAKEAWKKNGGDLLETIKSVVEDPKVKHDVAKGYEKFVDSAESQLNKLEKSFVLNEENIQCDDCSASLYSSLDEKSSELVEEIVENMVL